MLHCGIKCHDDMTKKGKKLKERKGYFYEVEENAIIQYIQESDIIKKNNIFNEILYPALSKMIESIIRRYKLFIPDEDFKQNFNDTISYLLTKIDHFRPSITGYDEIKSKDEIDDHDFEFMAEEEYRDKYRNASDEDPDYIKVYMGSKAMDEDSEEKEGSIRYFKKETHKYKAYSYCGTVCKNYLMFKSTQYAKKQQRNLPYDEMFEDISNSSKYSTSENNNSELAENLVKQISDEIEVMISSPKTYGLNENQITVGKALIELMRNWEEVLFKNENKKDSNKLQKSSVLYFLREETMMTTKEVRDNMRPFKSVYALIKKAALE